MVTATTDSVLAAYLGRSAVLTNTMAERLPDFLGLGTQKGGTTTLHQLLGLHPDVHLPDRKEVHYCRVLRFRRRLRETGLLCWMPPCGSD